MDVRTVAYATAMEKMYQDYPDNLEVAAFYALSLLGYRWSSDEGTARQERAGSVAAEVQRRAPEHPGAAPPAPPRGRWHPVARVRTASARRASRTRSR